MTSYAILSCVSHGDSPSHPPANPTCSKDRNAVHFLCGYACIMMIGPTLLPIPVSSPSFWCKVINDQGCGVSSHPQTVARKCAILTRLARISIIQGCSSIRQGEARREGSFSRLFPISGVISMGKGHIPAFNEILEVVTPLNPRFGFIFQFRDLLPNDIGKEIDKSCTGLHLRAVGREGEPMLCHFEKCDAGTPNIGCDRVGLAGDSFWCHVV
jgi:hypothetical protein